MGYDKGKIYKLWSYETDDIYIGSTTNTLVNRLCEHKSGYKRWKAGKQHYLSSCQLFERGDVMIELLENFPCECKEELNAREGFYIRQEKCVNKQLMGRTRKEYYEDNREAIMKRTKEYYEENKEAIGVKTKEYAEKNKEKIAQKNKEYYENNKEVISVKTKEYRKENKEKIKEQKKEHYETNKEAILKHNKEYREGNKEAISERRKKNREKNKEAINEKRKEKVVCECGEEVNKNHHARHRKTTKHKELMELKI